MMTGSAPIALAAASTSARVASGRPKRMLSATVARLLAKLENRNLFWGALVLLRVPERAALGVQVGADPAGLALADAAVSIQHPDQATVRGVAFASPIGVVSLTIAPGRSKVTHADAGGYPHHLTGHDWARRNRRLLAAEVSTVRRAATV
jgi:hypothetical protein